MKILSFVLFFVFAPPLSFAGEPDLEQAGLNQEISHLLNFISNSGCRFVRNGVNHTPSEAVIHITKKREHFEEKIKTAEDFIYYSATKSMVSQKRYHVKCLDGRKMRSDVWLLSELETYRASQLSTSNKEPINSGNK